MAGGSISASTLSAVDTTVKAAWLRGFSDAQNNLPWGQVTTDLGKSPTKIRSLDWLGETADMQDATRDGLKIGGVRRYNFSITHKVYKAALRFRISDLDTDNLGQLRPRVDGLARKAAGHPGRLAFDQLEANPTAFDGTSLFADTRTWGLGANFDNNLAGAGVTSANIETDIAAVRAAMLRAQDDQGEEMELSPNVLIIPPELSLVFGKVLGPTRQAGGDTAQVAVVDPSQGNVWKAGGYTVIELARLTDTNNWYALHVGAEINPFVYSWVAQPSIMNSPTLNDDSAKFDDELIWVVRGEYNVGVSLPQYFIRVVNS